MANNDAHRVLWCELQVGSLGIRAYLVDRNKFPELKNNVGFFSAEAGLILIGWDLNHDLAENTLLHELGHAAVYAFGVKFSSSDSEEDTVNPLTSSMYDTLKRNGMLVFPPRPEIPTRRRKR